MFSFSFSCVHGSDYFYTHYMTAPKLEVPTTQTFTDISIQEKVWLIHKSQNLL